MQTQDGWDWPNGFSDERWPTMAPHLTKERSAMKHKVDEMEGALLDAAVAKALADPRISMWGSGPWIEDGSGSGHGSTGRSFNPSSDWRDGGPIIEQDEIELRRATHGGWHAGIGLEDHHERAGIGSFGPTALIAAMRAKVASKFGDTVELP